MYNNLMNLKFDGRSVRIIMRDGEPWWVAKDVADILDYSGTDRLTKRLDTDEFIPAKLAGMNMESILINESGLYNAILGSIKTEAKAFKKWITSVVLPQIRKTGAYGKVDVTHITKVDLAKMLIESEEQRIEAEKLLAKAQPKIEAFDRFLQSKNTLGLRDTAKLIGMTPKRFITWLKAQKILYRNDTQHVMQPYLNNGWLKQTIFVQTLQDGARQRYQARVTAKGIAGLRELAKEQGMLIEQIEADELLFALESQGKIEDQQLIETGTININKNDESIDIDELLKDFI